MCVKAKQKGSVFGKSKTDSVFFLIRFSCEDYGKLRHVFILLPVFFLVLFFVFLSKEIRFKLSTVHFYFMIVLFVLFNY